MAGVSCRAGTEAIVGLSNPSYKSEGFRILFPGAAASGPSPNNPAFPSPGSLWGVTFCSILTAGNRRFPQPSKVRVASDPLTARPSITREVGGGRCPWPSRRLAPRRAGAQRSPPRPLPVIPGSLARSAGGGQKKMAAASAAIEGTGSSNRHSSRPQTPSIQPAVGPQGSPLPVGTVQGGPRSRCDLGWRRMNTKSGLWSRRLHL